MTFAAAITGLGLITPLGTSPGQTWNALLEGRAIFDHARISEIEEADRVLALSRTAARSAINQARWSPEILSDPQTALVLGTSKGPIESWLRGPLASLSCGIGQTAGALSSALQMGAGIRLTYSAACASGLHALIRGAMLLSAGEARRVLVVAAEASVHPLFISSFSRLGVLAPDGFGCRPFDASRRGFVMSEAAAAVCLELSETAGGQAIAFMDRFALGGEAAHLTAGDPTGKNLRRLLDIVIDDRKVDLVHAHGTGTVVNDPVELSAIESVIARVGGSPMLYSHKGALGHSLGASGLVSIVLNCFAHQTGAIPPNMHTRDPLPTCRVQINRQGARLDIRRSIALATGFGGPTAVVSLTSN